MSDRSAQHQQLADALLEAYQTKQAIPPLRDQLENMNIDDAYAVQQIQEKALLARGEKIIGRKIGLTSLAMQKLLGVDSPDFGFMTDDARFIGNDDAHFNSKDFLQPRIEPELAFYLKEDLAGPGVTLEQAIDAIDTVHLAIEIVDSRIADWNIHLVDTVADNASYGAIAWSKEPIEMNDLKEDLLNITCKLTVNGEVVGEGTGADVMGHPAAPMQWLANTLGEQGVSLKKGQVVLPGSFCAMIAVDAGTSVTADYGKYGTFTIHFD